MTTVRGSHGCPKRDRCSGHSGAYKPSSRDPLPTWKLKAPKYRRAVSIIPPQCHYEFTLSPRRVRSPRLFIAILSASRVARRFSDSGSGTWPIKRPSVPSSIPLSSGFRWQLNRTVFDWISPRHKTEERSGPELNLRSGRLRIVKIEARD